jgi:phosphoribosylcarboxyaminoimidazole (NCAIR) mutase
MVIIIMGSKNKVKNMEEASSYITLVLFTMASGRTAR